MLIAATHHQPFPGHRPGTLCSCCSDQLVLFSSFCPSQSAHEQIVVTIDEKYTQTTGYNQEDVKVLFLPQHCTLPI